jgi:hypothetical protein
MSDSTSDRGPDSPDPKRQLLPGEHENTIIWATSSTEKSPGTHSDRSESCKGAVEQTGGARPLHLAFVSVFTAAVRIGFY